MGYQFPAFLTPAVIWVCLGVVLFIFEIMTPGFVIACFGIGCFAAAITQVADLGLTWQLAAFCVGTLLSLLLFRPIVLKRIHNTTPQSTTNAHALIGQVGVVSTAFDDVMFEGRVKVGGDDWKARTATALAVGTRVIVEKVEGVTLTVRPE